MKMSTGVFPGSKEGRVWDYPQYLFLVLLWGLDARPYLAGGGSTLVLTWPVGDHILIVTTANHGNGTNTVGETETHMPI